MPPREPDRRYLRVYVSDHLAISEGILSLARRAAAAEHWAGHRDAIESVAEAVGADRRDVEAVAAARELTPNPVKRLLARAGERAGRLKGNGRIVRSSPLAPLVELEGLRLGLAGCRAFWETLAALDIEPERTDRSLARLRHAGGALEELHAPIATSAFAD